MQDTDFTQFAAVLIWIVSGGGSGAIAYWLWGRLETWFKAVGALNKELKRYLSLTLTALIALSAFGLQLTIGYRVPPLTPDLWVEQIFSIVAVSVIAAQAIHGWKQLRAR